MTKSPARNRVLLSGAAAVVVALASCTTPDEPDDASTTTSAPREDFAVNMAGCLQEKGWNVEAHEETNSFGNVDGLLPEQAERYQEDSDECLAEFGYDPAPPPITPERAEVIYEVMLEVAQCIRDLGFHVPEAPSKQAWVEERVREGIGPWHPYDALVKVNSDAEAEREFDAARDACPVELP